MTEHHVISALQSKRAELADVLRQLEQQRMHQQANLSHLEATMRLFDPNTQLEESHPRQRRTRSVWFRQGECLRLIYDQLRDASQPVTTRVLAERIMRVKAIPTTDVRHREMIQKTLLGSLNRAKETIARVKSAGVVSWQLI
jgi:hypothetical protein